MPAPSIFGEPAKTLSVVVPAYNEEDRLAPMLEETLAYLQKRRDRQVMLPTGAALQVSASIVGSICGRRHTKWKSDAMGHANVSELSRQNLFCLCGATECHHDLY